jgi:uncharacterized protein (DUF849 family)
MIINVTPTGMIPTKKMNSKTPITVQEIVDDVNRCASIGANIAHIHARDEDGKPTYKKDIYAKIIEGIRNIHPKLVICVSLSGRNYNEFEKRADPLSLTGDLKPDMGSLTLSSLNFVQGASINEPEMIKQLANRMNDLGIMPELEAFDAGMVNYAQYLYKKSIIRPPFYFNIILNNITNAQVRLSHLAAIIDELPNPCYWCCGGIGLKQLDANLLGMIFGSGVRIGLEDNPVCNMGNVELVERVLRLAKELGKKVASHQEVRDLLF